MADICTGFTPCFASVATQAFWDSYGDFPVQNLCDNEPLACYQAYLNGNMCPEPDDHLVQPDCGGWQSAAILLYDCHTNSMGNWFNMPGSPGMDCQRLYDETGYCFDQPGSGGHHSGECQLNPGPPPPPGPLDPKREYKPRPRSGRRDKSVRTITSCPPGKTFHPLPDGEVETVWDGSHTIIDIVRFLDEYGY